MKIVLNCLPTRTWNHLRMNESRVDVEGGFEAYRPEVCRNPAEVLWQPEARWQHPETAHGLSRELTEQLAGFRPDLVETAEDAVMTKPIVLRYRYDGKAQKASKLVLHARKGSLLKAVLVLEGECPLSAIETEILAEDQARVELYAAQLLGADTVFFHEISGLCLDQAQVRLTRLELGAKKSYTGANLDLVGKESDFTTKIGYHAAAGQRLDMNYVALHHGEKTTSLMEADGTVEEHAEKIFRGTIDFQKGCKGAKGTENENVLLLGEEMVNQTIPLILCKEEDVEGNHGASIGRLDDKVLFYLGSRGISEEAAQQIIAKSRIEAVCNLIPDEAVREQVHGFEYRKGHADDAER